MDQLIQYLGLGWVGSLLGIVGILLSIWFYIKSVQRAAPVAAFESIRLVGTSKSALPEAVTVLYYDRRVPRVTRSHVRIWNSGNATLDGKSIASVDPVRLEVEDDSEFLSVIVTKKSRDVTQLSAEILRSSPNKAVINFDFLDPGDGAIIECLHTGNEISPTIKGVIKGIPKGIVVKEMPVASNTSNGKKRFYKLLVVGIGVTLGGIMTIWSTFYPSAIPDAGTINKTFKFYLTCIMGFAYVGLGIYALSSVRNPLPKSLRGSTNSQMEMGIK